MMGCTSHGGSSQGRTLMNGWKIGSLLISKWNAPFAVVGSASSGYPQEVTLSMCYVVLFFFVVTAAFACEWSTARKEQSLVHYWKYDTARRGKFPNRLFYILGFAQSSWNSLSNDEATGCAPVVTTQHNHVTGGDIKSSSHGRKQPVTPLAPQTENP